MTSLQEQVLVLQVSIDNVNSELDQVRKDKLAAYIRVVAPLLKVFPDEVVTLVTSSAIIFKEDGKDLFTIYFEQDWKTGRIDDLELNYYSSRIKSKDTFELKRLRLLGYAADIVASSSNTIVTELNKVDDLDSKQLEDLHQELNELRKSQRNLVSLIDVDNKQELLSKLLSGGVTFNENKYIRLKHNFTDRMSSVRITNMSKSGKTCNIKYSAVNREYEAGEENMSVQLLIDRLYVHYKDIVSTLELV